jgi:peptidoglycan-associated lipoprotein
MRRKAEKGENMATWTHPRGRRRAAGLMAALGLLAMVVGCQSVKRPMARGPVIQAPSTCVDFTVSIYFESYSAAITPQARQLIAAAARRARGCDVTGVRVTGLADSPGGPDVNLALSKHRAEAVTLALHGQGFNTVEFQVAAAGDVGSQTAAGQARPLRRRADVQIHLAPRNSSPGR